MTVIGTMTTAILEENVHKEAVEQRVAAAGVEELRAEGWQEGERHVADTLDKADLAGALTIDQMTR